MKYNLEVDSERVHYNVWLGTRYQELINEQLLLGTKSTLHKTPVLITEAYKQHGVSKSQR